MPATVEERLATTEAAVIELRADVHQIGADVRSMRDLLAGRPSWTVTTIITLLFGAASTLAALLASAYQ